MAITMMASYVGAEEIDFNRQIRPLLNQHCIACHGPDEADRQADLRLDTYAGATEYAITPGDPDDSEVIVRIITEDVDERMPPAGHDSLKPHEIELLKTWISQGAKYRQHWSFAPIENVTVPSVETRKKVRVQNSIDAFILKRLHDSGLSQNPPSKPRALVRRTSLDLTGLPPAAHDSSVQEQVDTYLAEPNNKQFANVVQALLETPAYSEHWAAMWMDIARYADTVGYAGDEPRNIWPWRDWLIRALQSDMSYEQLSIEMIAGDMLPDASEEQILATAFHRNTLSNNEGGTNDEEFRTIAIKDRLSTTLNAWMGLTVRCAECHSHKYDPISQQEYYQLLDFFNQTADADKRNERPILAVKLLRDRAEIERIKAEIAAARERQKKQPKLWHALTPTATNSRNGTEFEVLEDQSILAKGASPKVEEYQFEFELPAGKTIAAIRLEAMPHKSHQGRVGRHNNGSFILTQIRMEKVASENTESIPFAAATADYHQANHHPKTAILSDIKSGSKQGWAVGHPSEQFKKKHEAIFELKQPLTSEDPIKIRIYLLQDSHWPTTNLGRVRIAIGEMQNAVAKYDKKQLNPWAKKIQDLESRLNAAINVPVMSQLPEERRRETHIMLRGNFQSKGDKVSASFPVAFVQSESDFALDRLGLAKWMFDKKNPLTARVAVNRYWARLMGVGLVETEEDFGTQGALPSHPELLDHLATQFRSGGWDTRQLLKTIVLSATYQQSQQVTGEALRVDPRNRLLSRGPRIRLSAEVVRDQALAVSGLLSKKMYGKPVYPPNPVKRVVNAFTGGTQWKESRGEDRFRRAIYTYMKRSSPHPLFETFDMASREVCNMRRLRTNTPLQSFMTLNDVMFIEAAQGLAAKMIQENPDANIEKQIGHGTQLALYQPATKQQLSVLSALYESSRSRFEVDLKSAFEMVSQPTDTIDFDSLANEEKQKMIHNASLTVVANVILNLDSF